MLTPPGSTESLALERRQRRLQDAQAFRDRPRRRVGGRARRLLGAITSIIA